MLHTTKGGNIMGIFEPWHLLLILAIVLIIFGPGKLPEVGKAMGKTIKEFRQASSATLDDLQDKAKPAQEQIVKAAEQKEDPSKIN
jgi:sec-independent protein translocase protein TatA